MIDVEEVRYLNGWSRDKKKGSSRMDGTPVDIFDELRIDTMSDYTKFLPETLPERFTTKDYAKCAHITQKLATVGLNILLETETVKRVGKIGNAFLYEKTHKTL